MRWAPYPPYYEDEPMECHLCAGYEDDHDDSCEARESIEPDERELSRYVSESDMEVQCLLSV